MLAEYSDDEIEVVLAHELAHHVHGDIWKGIVLRERADSRRVLRWRRARCSARLAPPWDSRGPADVAGLPVLLLAAGAVSLVMLPARTRCRAPTSEAPIDLR